MGRSIKKGPYVQPVLLERVRKMNESGEKSRSSRPEPRFDDIPRFCRHTFAVHDGRKHVPVYVTRTWLGTSSASLPPLPGPTADTPAPGRATKTRPKGGTQPWKQELR
ncbi:MAG: ribosomal protein S19 family protein [Anaerotruncus massiliensis (ex Togo et al. 2019)]